MVVLPSFSWGWLLKTLLLNKPAGSTYFLAGTLLLRFFMSLVTETEITTINIFDLAQIIEPSPGASQTPDGGPVNPPPKPPKEPPEPP